MKKTTINLGVLLVLMSLNANAQKRASKAEHVGLDILKMIKDQEDPALAKSTYVFKTHKEKETVVKAAYDKLNKKLDDPNYSVQELKKDEREFVFLWKARIEGDADADV